MVYLIVCIAFYKKKIILKLTEVDIYNFTNIIYYIIYIVHYIKQPSNSKCTKIYAE